MAHAAPVCVESQPFAGKTHDVFMETMDCDGINNRSIRKLRNFCSFFPKRGPGLESCRAENIALCRRRTSCLLSVRASTGAGEVAVQKEQLTKKDLVDFLASGCTSKDQWRIGTEHEKFGFDEGTLQPIGYHQIVMLLEGIATRYNWDKIMDNGLLVGLKKAGKSITLEGGGQVELSGAPVENLHETFAELQSHFTEVNEVAKDLRIKFFGIGFQPKWPLDDIPTMPQEKIKVMQDCLAETGTTGVDLMLRTCTVQVNLDYSSEEDMVNKYRVGLALQPIATALFANSPFTEGKPNGFVSYRSELYKSMDNDRTGMLPFVFGNDFGFKRYVEYALDVPMYYVHRDNRYVNCCGESFRDFIAGKLPSLPGEKATLKDWENHLVQIYAEVRLKRILEMRGSDVGNWTQLTALPALWVGLLYDEKSLKSVLALIKDWTPEEIQTMRNKVPRLGLKTPFRDSLLKHVAQDVVILAKEGLQRRGLNEEKFLNQTLETAQSGLTPAERLMELYNSRWKKSVDPIFEEFVY